MRSLATIRLAAAALVLAASAALPAHGHEQECDTPTQVLRPVVSIFTLDVGHASLLDTYMTPIAYHGQNVRLGYEHFQATGFAPLRWTRQLEVGVDYDHTRNPAGNHTMHSLMLEGRWSMMRRWYNPGGLHGTQLMIGPMTQLRGGAIYNGNNSNNVATAKIHWAVGFNAMAVWNTRLLGRRLSLRYEGSLPVAGVFFSPDYDEAYYEIYEGNHRGLVHLGWWGNRFDFTHALTADWRLGGTTLRLGYRGRIETSWVNHINTHIFTHALVIGIGGELLSLRHGKKPRGAVVSPQY